MHSAQFGDICPNPLNKWAFFSYIINRAGRSLSFHPPDTPWAVIGCVCAFPLEVDCASMFFLLSVFS